MYIPQHFEVSDPKKINEFVDANSFGQLISLHDGEIVASHVPFLYLKQEGKLIAHVARTNPQWEQIEGQAVLVTLQGEHAYVSPSWYDSAGVPTWNYQSAHIRGSATTFFDPDRLQRLVDTLTAQNESAYAAPWQPDYPASMLRGIVGIEIAISAIQCKFKISQNRSEVDQSNVSRQHRIAGFDALADAMEAGRDSLEKQDYT